MKQGLDRVILGLDPGTASTGYGIIAVNGNCFRALAYGVVETDPSLRTEQRLDRIFGELQALLAEHGPSATAVESLYFNTNVQTALAVGQAKGVALLACARAGCEVFEYTPQQVKQAVVGYGKASKEQVMEMTRVLLGLQEVPRPDHAADALAVAICHANTCGLRERLARSLGLEGTRPQARGRRP